MNSQPNNLHQRGAFMRDKFALNVKYEEEKRESGLTSFAGIPLFLEYLKGIGFDRMVGSIFNSQSNQGYHPLHHVLSLVLLNLSGGESVSDIEFLETDSGLKRFFKHFEASFVGLKDRVFRKGRKRVFPSPTGLFNFLGQFNASNEEEEREATAKGKAKILPTDESLQKLIELNKKIIHTAQQLSEEKIATLDMDNNLISSHKSNAKVSYKKDKSYHPFNVYWYEQDLMIHSEFRDGNVVAGFEQLRVFQEAEKMLPPSVTQLKLRSDTAGYQTKFLDYLDSGKSRFGKVEFSVSCNVTSSFRQAVLKVEEKDWQRITIEDEFGKKIKTNHEVAEVCYVPETSNKSKNAPVFRYLATREKVSIQMEVDDQGKVKFDTPEHVEKKLHLEKMGDNGYKIFGIVTNRTESPVEILLWHRKRNGNSEHEHSRLTSDMASGRFPSDSFGENAAWWHLSVISLNLLKIFQRQVLPEQEKRSRIKRLNLLLFKVAAKVLLKARGVIIKIAKGSVLFNVIKEGRGKIKEIYQFLSQSRVWIKNEEILV